MISGRRESPEYIGARFRPERLAEEPAERAGCFLLMAAREWNSQWRASKRLSPEFPPARRPAPPASPRAWRRAGPCRVGRNDYQCGHDKPSLCPPASPRRRAQEGQHADLRGTRRGPLVRGLMLSSTFVDEAQYFKNLFYVTKMTRIAGLPQTASERAFDMFLKVRHVQSLNSGGGVVFATGTPIANSMAEMFTMQRYLQPEDLKKHNLHHFDAWAATFGEPVTAMELSPYGAGYRMSTRFARFINVPELMQMFRQVADVQTAAMLDLPRPKLDGEKPAIRNAPATPELKAFVQGLAARAERLKTGRVDPSEDNMLKITSEGRKAALDLRLMIPTAREEPQSKVNQAVENIHRIWQATTAERSAQMVFCDLSTPKDRGFSVYRDIAEKLECLGVPSGDIAFIQDFDTDAGKLALFRDVRAGKVRILFGSTQKMGSGTNVQERLIALHHLDAPWRPADVEQREGRILRQGNKNPVIQIYRYVSEGSFHAYTWHTLETKAKFIAQVMSGDMTIRRLEDLESAALTYAEVKAIASGNPLVIEKAQVDAELMRLTRLRSAHAEEQTGFAEISSNLARTPRLSRCGW